jgi:hypothetical protein
LYKFDDEGQQVDNPIYSPNWFIVEELVKQNLTKLEKRDQAITLFERCFALYQLWNPISDTLIMDLWKYFGSVAYLNPPTRELASHTRFPLLLRQLPKVGKLEDFKILWEKESTEIGLFVMILYLRTKRFNPLGYNL